MFNKTVFSLICCSFLLFACGEEKEPVQLQNPVKLTADDVGHFCGMLVAMHSGPKAQVFLKGEMKPLWFVSARDSLAYSRMPDEAFKVSTIYVSDMGKAESWNQPGDNAWVKADQAWYVEGSSRSGGMGMAEWVPFSEKEKAQEFVAEYGGTVVQLHMIATDDLLGEDKPAMDMTNMAGLDHSQH